MSLVHFRRAVASEAKPLVGLYSESGCGKTKSALLIARGFTGDMSKVGMVETESGRGEAYADEPDVGGYSVLPLREDFSPTSYGKAIRTAEAAKLQALIIDSASHEWEGVGGVLAMAAANQEAGKKGPLVWQKPKIDHAREFMLRLTQTPIPLVIVCMRAKYPMYEVKPADVERWERAGRPGGKPPKLGEWARSWQLEPKQSEDILYEMFVHGWIDKEHRFHGTKYTLDSMRAVFIDNEPISIETGVRLAAWAQRRVVESSNGTAPSPSASHSPASAPTESGPTYISTDQATMLSDLLHEHSIDVAKFCAAAKVATLGDILAADYQRALGAIDATLENRRKKATA